jgi:uncharacterized protein (TIGR03437 family)
MRYCLAVLLLTTTSRGAPASLPLFFEENRGQSAQEVRFVAPGSNSIFLTEREAVIAFAAGEVLRIRPEGAMASKPEALEALPGRSNYLNRETPIVGVPHYARICYRSVYPGIDIAYHGRGSELEYDFSVAAGARPESIRLRLQGAEELRVDSQGNLVARMRGLTFIQRKPEAWQSDGNARRPVDVRYLVSRKREVSFAISAYDRTQPLTIDPLIDYVTDLGATATDAFNFGTVPYAIAADSAGNAYIAGDATSGPFPSAQGQTPPTHGNTGFVAKLSSDGKQLVYATYLNLPAGQAVAVDGQGSAYVAGGGSIANPAITYVSYIVKLTPDGSGLASNYSYSKQAFLLGVGPLGVTSFTHLALDSAGNVYASGRTYDTTFPTTPGAYQATFPGQITLLGTAAYGCLIKLNASGSVQYATYLRDALASNGEPGTELAVQLLAADRTAQNAIIFTVTTPSASGQNSNSLLKLGPGGEFLSTTSVAQTPIIAPSIATDSAGNLYLAGNGPGFGAMTTIGPNFLVEFDPGGSFVAARNIPLNGDLHLDGSGNAYIVAAARVGNTNLETPSVSRVAKGLTSVTTNPLTITPITDQIQSSTVDDAGNVYVVLTPGGLIGSPPQIPATPGAYQTSGGGFAVLKADATALTAPPPPPAIPLIAGITNAASGQSGIIAPGEILAIYGANLGPAQLVSATFDANGLLPTTLAGASVVISGQHIPLIYAPLLYVSASQVSAIVPVSLVGSATVQISYQGLFSPAIPVPVGPAVPGLFSADSSGHGQGAILNQDGSINSVSHPAALGSVISLFCAGCGLTAAPGIDGAIASSLAPLAGSYTVMIGNQQADVLYAGAAPGLVNGAVQINARIPSGVSGDAVPVGISVASFPPSFPVTVAVH